MIESNEFKTKEWMPYKDSNMVSVEQVRKTVYNLSRYNKSMIEGLIIKMGMDYIEYSDLEGETEKEKVISLFYLCQKQNLLNNLYAAIRDFDTTDLNLFIEKNTPVILSKIERDENWKIADYYPTGFSIYVPKSKTQSLNVIAAYSYDTWRYVYSEKFRTLMSLLDK